MAVGAHPVPVLCLAGPVEPVARANLLFGVDGVSKMKPSPSLCVPCYREALQTATVKRHKVLLKRSVSEGIGDFEILEAAGRAFGVDKELFSLAEEAVYLSPVPELKVVEVAQHAAVGGDVHRQVMVRSLPEVILSLVTLNTGGGACELRTRFHHLSMPFNG